MKLALLVIPALLLAGCATTLKEGSPGSVTKAFITKAFAADQGALDLVSAGYLEQARNELERMRSSGVTITINRLDVTNENIVGDKAVVAVYLSGSVGGQTQSATRYVRLVKENGAWKVDSGLGETEFDIGTEIAR